MTVLIDGVETKVLNDVKVIVESEGAPDLHLTFTHEGVVADLVAPDGIVDDTRSSTYDELVADWFGGIGS